MDKYKLIGKIGKYTYGDIILVKRIKDHKLFMMKKLNNTDNHDNANKDNNHDKDNKLRKDIKGYEFLNHVNIIKYYESIYYGNQFCMIFEYPENGTLMNQIQKAKANHTYIPEYLIIEWLIQICLGIKYLHDKNIFHKDINAQNIFLTKSRYIKLGDYVTLYSLDNQNITNESLINQAGIPPEICLGSIFTDKSDMWMLGCLLYELCSLKKPFYGNNLSILVQSVIKHKLRDIPKHYSFFLKNLITNLLEKNPENRPSANQILKNDEIINQINYLKDIYDAPYRDALLDILKDFGYITINSSNNQVEKAEQTNLPSSLNTSMKLNGISPLKKDLNDDLRSYITSFSHQKSNTINQNIKKASESMVLKQKKSQGDIDSKATIDNLHPTSVKHKNSISSLLEQKAKLNMSPENKNKMNSMIECQDSKCDLIKTKNNRLSLFESSKSANLNEINKDENHKFSEHLSKHNKIMIKSSRIKTEVINYNNNNLEFENLSDLSSVCSEDFDNTRTENKHQEKPLLSYYRSMNINTDSFSNLGLSIKENRKHGGNINCEVQLRSNTQTELDDKLNFGFNMTKSTNSNKIFTFSDKLFDYNSPTSINRIFWFCQFLKKKIGNERYEKLKAFLENTPNVVETLDEKKTILIDILGEENRDCIKILKCLISTTNKTITTSTSISLLNSTSLLNNENLFGNKMYSSLNATNDIIYNKPNNISINSPTFNFDNIIINTSLNLNQLKKYNDELKTKLIRENELIDYHKKLKEQFRYYKQQLNNGMKITPEKRSTVKKNITIHNIVKNLKFDANNTPQSEHKQKLPTKSLID